jgi:type VI secretion system secreted protein VgrG
MAKLVTLKIEPLQDEELHFSSLTYAAGLSMLEDLQLCILSPNANLGADDVLGQLVSLTLHQHHIDRHEQLERELSGYVRRFEFEGHRGRYYRYRVEIVPWMWFLTRRADCRIFQDQSVPDIVQSVLAEHVDGASVELKLVRSYRKRTYCVQYRETDFNFIARLLEDEGIYWYFEHQGGRHKLIVVDDLGSHEALAGYEALPYYANREQVPPDAEYLTDWRCSREVRANKVALTSYDFTAPGRSLKVGMTAQRSYSLADHELFDFQGDYAQSADGEQLLDNRIDEEQARFEQFTGHSNASGLAAGHLFELTQHPRDDQNAQYLCTQLRLVVQAADSESDQGRDQLSLSLAAIPASQQFRPPRRTPRPFVQGPQTAVVVGPSGEEIHTDKYGRVKAQFHWDRKGQKNEKSSCWMRVSSPWAGKSFGFIQIPRIGQEVVVDFLEGDPDQPLITGRVYNDDQMPPWDLPANASQSGVLTRSTKGGAYNNANALRFEDKKGSEQVWLHAEKNQDIEVENDETHWVGHDRDKTIDHDETSHIKHDRTETVDHDERITIHHDRTETVDHNESITIGLNRTESVGNNESISIGNNRTESVGANESVSIGKNRTMDVADNEALSVGKNRDHTVGKNETVTVGDNFKHTVGKNAEVEIGDKRQTQVGKDDMLQVGKKFYLEAGDEITLKTGNASITLKKDGTIQIKGKDITVTGSGKIGIKASSNVVIKGSKIAQN